MVQLLVGELEFFVRRPAVVTLFRFKSAEFFGYRTNCVFTAGFDHLGALKLVRINIADKLAKRVEVFAARARLIVVFDEWNGQASRLQSKAMIIATKMNKKHRERSEERRVGKECR